jgi:hypothetical protein
MLATPDMWRKRLKAMPGHQGYLEFAVEVGAELPPHARRLLAERAVIFAEDGR